jgi:hypothetical protein
VVYNMNDLPLGFGSSAKSTVECRKLDPGAVVVFNVTPDYTSTLSVFLFFQKEQLFFYQKKAIVNSVAGTVLSNSFH